MNGRYIKNFDSSALEQYQTEFLIIGGGIAGLYTALAAAKTGAGVTILTKEYIEESNTYRAQGGVAAALGQYDSTGLHKQDTFTAGAGLCDQEAVEVLVNAGPDRVRELIDYGVAFDFKNGEIELGQEGCHSRRRILHANGDATGAEIVKTLAALAAEHSLIEILEGKAAVDLLVHQNVCQGVLVFDKQINKLQIFWGRVVVLATGGGGQLYSCTTNPAVATADGVALAYRAGTEVMDIEFIQFHPTVLVTGKEAPFLISEAVRGEGAILYNSKGERFMPHYHEMAELAPRDIVTRAILNEMLVTETREVFLDISHLKAHRIQERFPNITATCNNYGYDITTQPIPVAPAAHYMMGGVKTDLWGETCLDRLFCCGEVSCVGIHGANRLASNSLLDALVMGNRIVERIKNKSLLEKMTYPQVISNDLADSSDQDFAAIKKQFRQMMDEKAGPLRCEAGLTEAMNYFERWDNVFKSDAKDAVQVETLNMLTVGQLVVQAALMRRESRGGHFRTDYPYSDGKWQKHILLKR